MGPPRPDVLVTVVRRELDELFNDVRRGPRPSAARGFSPTVDVYECGNPRMIVVIAALPGVARDELALEVRGRDLILAGRRRPADPEGRAYQQLEIARGPFRRVVHLGADVRAEDAQASLEDGLLRVELPLARVEHERVEVPVRATPKPSG